MITTDSQNYVVGGELTAACTLFGLSTDNKPTANIANGSAFIEMDTSKIFFFDAAGTQWLEWGAEA